MLWAETAVCLLFHCRGIQKETEEKSAQFQPAVFPGKQL